jgi:hypothetical protein
VSPFRSALGDSLILIVVIGVVTLSQNNIPNQAELELPLADACIPIQVQTLGEIRDVAP